MTKKYIDAEELIRLIALTDIFKSIDDFIDSNNSEVVKIIESMSAADVEPVRHGKWIKAAGLNPRCSVCKKWAICDKNAKPILTDYCPNCGAKMDVE